ncbi:hypothetical protein SLA2020_422850 [Shorea laevis]
MKLSFSLPSKPSSRPKPSWNADEEPEKKEFVTEFDPTKTLANSRLKPNIVIPPKENEWRPYKKMKNLDLPLNSDGSRDLQFEVESAAAAADNSRSDNMSYGLNLRQSSKDGADAKQEVGESDSFVPAEEVCLQSLKEDLERLPEDRGFAEFEDCPVEDFAAALLAGYGWKEGQGIGRNAKEDVKVKQYERRGGREGLGFSSKDIKESLRDPKNNRGNQGREERVKEDGNGFFVGKDVRIIGGRDMGSKGTIVEKLGVDWVLLRLKKSEEEVKVRVFDIADLGSKEEEKCLKKLKELEIRDGKNSSHKGDERKVSKRSRESEKRGAGKVDVERVRSDKERGVSWLRSHIRVRIVSKNLQGGRLYLKKGEVVDVVGPYMCDVSMDDNRELIQGVEQELLETALPRRGGPVLVLYGRHKGAYGSLVERDLDRETGVVRDADSHELLNVKLEQLAEYVGDPSYIGY